MNTFKKWYGKLEEKESTIQPDLFPKEFATKRTTISGKQISNRSTEKSKLPNVNNRGRMISSVKQSLENFWKWFGDSEAVDDKGRPLVFFHGTRKDFDAFRTGLKTYNSYGLLGTYETKRSGIFVTADVKFAELFASQPLGNKEEAPSIVTVYAKAERPADLRSFQSIEYLVPGIEKRFVRWFDYLSETWEAFDDEEGEEFVDELKRLGYDSARIMETDDDKRSVEVWVLFESNQLKAVYGNVGTFSGASNRLTESEDGVISEAFQSLIEDKTPLLENVFRVGSESYFKLFEYARNHTDKLSAADKRLIEETDIGRFGLYEGKQVPLDCPMIEEDVICEAEYKGKTVYLNSPKRNSGSGKKYVVYTKNKKGNVIKVTFGDEKGGLTSKINDPKARKAFADRHQCHLKTDKTTPGYWSCRLPRWRKNLGLAGKNSSEFW